MKRCFFNDENVSIPLNRIDHKHRKIVGYYQISVFRGGVLQKSDTKVN
jgi:hypothetical protein